jgi:DNA polymerase-1
MERNGVLLDAAGLNAQSHQLGREMLELEQKAYELAGQPFNLNSPRQIQEILFDRQKLPVKKKTPRASRRPTRTYSPSSRSTTRCRSCLLEYRALAKLKSTYTDKLPRMVNAQTGRVHTTYSQTTAVTGRLASNDPNLQNIPIRTPQGRRIREAFIAPPGSKILSADYSQIELRIMAHISGDEGLRHAFEHGHDVHRATAAEVFGLPLDKVSEDERRTAKDDQLRPDLRDVELRARAGPGHRARHRAGLYRLLLRALPAREALYGPDRGSVRARKATSRPSSAGGSGCPR